MRPLTYGILAYFDAECEARVNDLTLALNNQGINSSIYSFNLRPHISLSSFETNRLPELVTALQQFASQEPALPLKLDAIGTFQTQENVLFLSPVVTVELLELHRRAHRLAEQFGENLNAYYQPGLWVPHLTLAMTITDLQLAQSLEIIRGTAVFAPCTLNALALLQFPPPLEITTFDLL